MTNLITAKGIVIHEMTIKDHDKRIIVFSKEYGKMVVFANGAKKAKSPLLAGTQPFVFAEFQMIEGRSSYTLRSASIIESFYEIRQDMETLAYGLYLLEVIGSVIQEMDPNEELLRLLYISLSALKTGAQSGGVVKCVFEFRSLNMLGFAPDLSCCMECGKEDGDFSLTVKGGLICAGCGDFNSKSMTQECLHVLRYIQGAPLGKLYHFKMDEALFQEVSQMTGNYFRNFVTQKFKSLDILG